MGIILIILFVIFAAVIGSEKGYSGALCGVAGFFGGLIAIIIIALLPNRKQEQEDTARREAEHNDEISQLKKRIQELEANQQSTDSAEEDRSHT